MEWRREREDEERGMKTEGWEKGIQTNWDTKSQKWEQKEKRKREYYWTVIYIKIHAENVINV